MGALKAAIEKFQRQHPAAQLYVLFDVTALRFGEELFRVQQQFPAFTWFLMDDVRHELTILRHSRRFGRLADRLLSGTRRWDPDSIPACPRQDGVPVRNLYDFFNVKESCSQFLFVFGGLLQTYEFSLRGPAKAWMLYRGTWALQGGGTSAYIDRIGILRDRIRLADHADRCFEKIGVYPDISIEWNDGTSQSLRSWEDRMSALSHGGEGDLYRWCDTEGDRVLKLYRNMTRCDHCRAELLMGLEAENVAFPIGMVRPLSRDTHRPVVGVVMKQLSGIPYDSLPEGARYPALRAVLLRLLELRLMDVFMVDLVGTNLAYRPDQDWNGAVLYDTDGFQIKNGPALAAHELSHPDARRGQLLLPYQQCFAEGAFLLYSLLRPDASESIFVWDRYGRRRFCYRSDNDRWPRKVPVAVREELLSELNSGTPPPRSLGEWIGLVF